MNRARMKNLFIILILVSFGCAGSSGKRPPTAQLETKGLWLMVVDPRSSQPAIGQSLYHYGETISLDLLIINSSRSKLYVDTGPESVSLDNIVIQLNGVEANEGQPPYDAKFLYVPSEAIINGIRVIAIPAMIGENYVTARLLLSSRILVDHDSVRRVVPTAPVFEPGKYSISVAFKARAVSDTESLPQAYTDQSPVILTTSQPFFIKILPSVN